MKRTLLLTALFFTTISFSQFILDHTFFYTRGVQRIVLENSGEKYYYVNYQTGVITFLNANYTPWKNVTLPLPAQTYSLGITSISENKINADANLEIVYNTYSAPAVRQSVIVNELGTVLLSVNDCNYLKLDEQEGLTTKIISSTGTVYTLPGLIAEHSYTVNYPIIELKRLKLENSGEKYYVLDVLNSLVALYNADHTFWKNITLPKPDGYAISSVNFLSENQINQDNLIEVAYNCLNSTQSESRIANENGTLLMTASHSGRFEISSMAGAPNKLMVYYLIGDFPDETSARTDVYSVPELILEHTYEDTVYRVKLENSGEKYHAYRNDYLNTAITVYNADHSVWKTIATPVQGFGETIENVFITETKVDPDAALEVFYTVSSNTLDGGHYYSKIVKEDGTEILDLPTAYDLQLSEFEGLPTKLMVYSQDGPSFDQLYYTSTVYKFDDAFAVADFDKPSMNLSPNPADDVVEVQSEIAVVEADLFDMKGVMVGQFRATNLQKISVENLSDGIYLAHLIDTHGSKSIHKIVVSH